MLRVCTIIQIRKRLKTNLNPFITLSLYLSVKCCAVRNVRDKDYTLATCLNISMVCLLHNNKAFIFGYNRHKTLDFSNYVSQVRIFNIKNRQIEYINQKPEDKSSQEKINTKYIITKRLKHILQIILS